MPYFRVDSPVCIVKTEGEVASLWEVLQQVDTVTLGGVAGGISNQKELEEYKEAHPATEVGSQLSPGGAVEDVLGAIFPTGFAPLPKVPFLRRDIHYMDHLGIKSVTFV